MCLELCTPAYSLHPKLHFDTNLIFVSLLVPEILAHFFCPHHYMMQQNLLKFAQWWLGVLSPAGGVLRRGLPSVILGKIRKIINSEFSAYFVQFLKSLLVRLNTLQFDVMGHIWGMRKGYFHSCTQLLLNYPQRIHYNFNQSYMPTHPQWHNQCVLNYNGGWF
jgi:hypothetical protein